MGHHQRRAYSLEQIDKIAGLKGLEWRAPYREEFRRAELKHAEALLRHGVPAARDKLDLQTKISDSAFNNLLQHRPSDAKAAALWAHVLLEMVDTGGYGDREDDVSKALREAFAALVAPSPIGIAA